MTEREANNRLAAVYFIIAALFFIASVFFFYLSGKQEVSTNEKAKIQCQIQLKSMGFDFSTNASDGQITAKQTGIAVIGNGVRDASTAISRCAGYQLKSFCAGNGCPTPGIQLTLRSVQ